MRRIVVIGASGAGKSMLAQTLADHLGMPHVELDALHWGPNWAPTPTEILRPRVEAAIAGDGWTVSGNYFTLRDSIWPRADTLIWLDYPMTIVMGRVVRRTVRRCLSGELLWSTNVETWQKSFLRSDSIIVWAWTMWRKYRRDCPEYMRSPELRDIRKYQFKSPRQTSDWLGRVTLNAIDH